MALRLHTHSEISSRILRRAIGDLIAADGVICSIDAMGEELDAFFKNGEEQREERPLLVNARTS